MKFMGVCPKCTGQLVKEPDLFNEEEIYCFNCAYRKPDNADITWDEGDKRFRPMTTAERLGRPGNNRNTMRSAKWS